MAAGAVHGAFLEVDFVEDLYAEVAVFGVGYCHGRVDGGECEGSNYIKCIIFDI